MKEQLKMIIGALVGVGVLFGASALIQPSDRDEQPAIGYVLDDPVPNPSAVTAHLKLMVAGGAFEGRDIYVAVSKRTAQENIDALNSFSGATMHVQTLPNNPPKESMKALVRSTMGIQTGVVLESK